MSKEALKQAFIDNLFYVQGRFREVATPNDLYMAAAYTVRDRLLERWVTLRPDLQGQRGPHRLLPVRRVPARSAPASTTWSIWGLPRLRKRPRTSWAWTSRAMVESEEEPGLGNGGLGRLAACYMDSLSTVQIPAIGYGIRYEFGIFDQAIEDGWQVEKSDTWLKNGNPWEIPRYRLRFPVKFGGRTEQYQDERGTLRVRWIADLEVNGVAYDTPILGYGVGNVSLLRLWKSEAPESFDFQSFNVGDYYGAVHAKIEAETISKVLYPNDEPEAGKELRLKQQYFFVSCSLQDMIRLHLSTVGDLALLP